MKWQTKPSGSNSGIGYMGDFFELCKRGDTIGIAKFLREKYKPDAEVVADVDPQH